MRDGPLSDGLGCLMEAKGRFSSRRPSRHPLHGRNDIKTSKKRFSRQKHAHKQRKQGLSCHHAPPLYIQTLQPLQPAKSGPVPRMRHAQARSGTIRYAQVLSETLCFNVGPTVLRATDTLHCFNGLQQPQRPSRPQAPEEPQRPQGWMLSFDSHHPIHKLSVKNQNISSNHEKCRILHFSQLEPTVLFLEPYHLVCHTVTHKQNKKAA